MTDAEFNKIVEARIEKIRKVLGKKAKEYARGDRLHNFKRTAAMLQCTPERALIGFLAKHIVSILDLVDDIEQGKPVDLAAWDEKLGDSVNYHVLLDALIIERAGKGAQ